jgi:hypothetical protein
LVDLSADLGMELSRSMRAFGGGLAYFVASVVDGNSLLLFAGEMDRGDVDILLVCLALLSTGQFLLWCFLIGGFFFVELAFGTCTWCLRVASVGDV